MRMFSGDWFEFKITSPQQARSWLEDQILKPLGLVMVVTASGQLTLKAMKNPANQTPVHGFTQGNILGIPEVRLAPVINALAYRLDADDSATNTSARTYNTTVTMLQQASYNLFRYLYNHQVEAAGLRTGRGGTLRAFLLAASFDRCRYFYVNVLIHTYCYPLRKLTWEKVREIRKRYIKGDSINGARALAKEFGINGRSMTYI